MALTKVTYAMIQGAPANVLDYGADPTGTADSTVAIQNAVDANSNVYIPSGTYLINASRITPMSGAKCGIELPANCSVWMEHNTELQVIPSSVANSAIFGAYDKENVTITGGYLFGDRDDHVGVTQFGHGIDFRGVGNGTIRDVVVKNCIGDGIYLGKGATGTFCNDIVVENVVCGSNFRNGLSVVAANNVRIVDSIFKNTNGVSPEAGIDIETNSNSEFNYNIVIDNCTFSDNSGNAVDVLRGKYVVISNCYMQGNYGGHNLLGSVGDAPTTDVKIINNTYYQTQQKVLGFYDNIDNILFQGNTVYQLTLTTNGIFNNNTTPTTTRNVKIVDNVLYGTTTNGYPIFSYSQTDALTNWLISGNTMYLGGGAYTASIEGAECIFENNVVTITDSTGAGSIALAFDVADAALASDNVFKNNTTTLHYLVSNAGETILNNNYFTQYFVPNNINIAAPSAGYWVKGTIIYNQNPSSAGYIGWVCTASGTPGTWKTFGVIS